MIRTIAGIAAILLLPVSAGAQERSGDIHSGTRLKLPTFETLAAPNADQARAMGWTSEMMPNEAKGATLPPVIQTRHRSVGRKILGGALGAVGGLFAGGYLGAKIEGNDCGCDDPGLKGALIGAPIGMITGAIIGAIVF